MNATSAAPRRGRGSGAPRLGGQLPGRGDARAGSVPRAQQPATSVASGTVTSIAACAFARMPAWRRRWSSICDSRARRIERHRNRRPAAGCRRRRRRTRASVGSMRAHSLLPAPARRGARPAATRRARASSSRVGAGLALRIGGEERHVAPIAVALRRASRAPPGACWHRRRSPRVSVSGAGLPPARRPGAPPRQRPRGPRSRSRGVSASASARSGRTPAERASRAAAQLDAREAVDPEIVVEAAVERDARGASAGVHLGQERAHEPEELVRPRLGQPIPGAGTGCARRRRVEACAAVPAHRRKVRRHRLSSRGAVLHLSKAKPRGDDRLDRRQTRPRAPPAGQACGIEPQRSHAGGPLTAVNPGERIGCTLTSELAPVG